MRIGELARRSGVAVPTIKYYLRSGLLSPGRATASNQALYDGSHLRRLFLVRVLTVIGNLSLDTTRAVLGAARDLDVALTDLLALADRASARMRDPVDAAIAKEAERLVSSALGTRDWQIRPDAAALSRLLDVCAAARLLDVEEIGQALARYAAAADHFAACDAVTAMAVARRMAADARDEVEVREALLVANVLGGALQAALRSLAVHEALTRILPSRAPRPASES
jgi:DNA-binding transcriptional MerR regulator